MSGDKFLEYKHTYFGETKVFECSLAYKTDQELVIIYKSDRPMSFMGIDFELGCISLGYYWTDRNYNVYHWKDPNGKTLLFYFNISADTNIGKGRIDWRDLILDIAVVPGKEPCVLDEAEIRANMNQDDLEIINKTRDQILSNIRRITDELEQRSSSLLRHNST